MYQIHLHCIIPKQSTCWNRHFKDFFLKPASWFTVCYLLLNLPETLKSFSLTLYEQSQMCCWTCQLFIKLLILKDALTKPVSNIQTNNNNLKRRPVVGWPSEIVPCSRRFIWFINLFDFVVYRFSLSRLSLISKHSWVFHLLISNHKMAEGVAHQQRASATQSCSSWLRRMALVCPPAGAYSWMRDSPQRVWITMTLGSPNTGTRSGSAHFIIGTYTIHSISSTPAAGKQSCWEVRLE